MSKTIKVKDLRKVVGDTDINGMFEEMLGLRDADIDIIRPKYVKVRNLLRYVCRVFGQFHDILIKDFPQFKDGLEGFKKHADNISSSNELSIYNGITSDLSNGQLQPETEELYMHITQEDMNKAYRKLKDNALVKSLIVLCSKLSRYHNNFKDPKNLRLNFVNQEPGLTFILFDFSTLDFKALWASQKINDSVKRYILTVLENLRKNTHEIYKCVTSPDVDVTKFTSTIITAIDDMRKRPELSRCGDAFNRIKSSVSLLENKFDSYYRESVASKNSDMIVLNFITDVSNQGGATPSLTRQFREIIKYMNKVSEQSGRAKDPNVKKIFAMLNSNFNLMEKNMPADVAADVTSDVTSEATGVNTNVNSESAGTDVNAAATTNTQQ